MSQPPPYNRLANFTTYALAHPSAPYNPSDHDAELNAVETTVDALCTNIALIQRDDGELANETVGIDQLETELRSLIAIGDGTVEVWTTGHTYHPGDAVAFGVDAYLCVVTHVAGTFALDLAAGYWVLIGIQAISVVANAALIAFTPVGTISSMNVQAAVAEVATDAAAATAAVGAASIPLAQKGVANGVATLDAAVKIPLAQLPDLTGSYIPITQKGAPLGVATLDAAGIVTLAQLPPAGASIPLAEKGAPNGVATLDGTGKVPVAQIPPAAGGPFVPVADKGVPNGVASLDAGGIVPLAQLPTLSSATKVQDAQPAGMVQGEQWFESDTGNFYLRYQNPDLTYTLVGLNAAGVPGSQGPTGPQGPQGPGGAPGSINRIINGKFAVDQRQAHNVVVFTTFGYGPDRWFVNLSGGGQVSQTSFADPSNAGEWRGRVIVTTADAALAAGDFYSFGQVIEGNNVADMNFGTATAKQFTFAAEMESSISGTFPISFRSLGGARSYVTTVALVAGVRTPVTITVQGDTASPGSWASDNRIGLNVSIGLGVGSTLQAAAANVWTAGNFATVAGMTNFMATGGNALFVRNARLYLGPTDLGVDQRIFADELELCKRYYQKSYPYGTTPGTVGNAGMTQMRTLAAAQGNLENSSLTQFSPEMNATPSLITIYSPTTGAANRVRDVAAATDIVVNSISDPGPKSMGTIVSAGVASGAGNFITWHWSAYAEL